MKYLTLILILALQAQSQAQDLVCDLKGKEFVRIFGLSQTAAPHQVTLRFRDAHPSDIVANVTTVKTTEFIDWAGSRVEMLRRIEAAELPYPAFHFTLEIRQSVGGHCDDLGCEQDAIFYHNNQTERLDCGPPRSDSRPNETASSDGGDSCVAQCGRKCLEQPIFCGGW